ncbi:DNA cytosine methyltransferase, partial [Halomonas sp. HMF6819]|uniref:DNA cytosine methyltransferase n=1 Tax=Halomonas sp. HMF6819 TaxID=3373085 RepID=UPI00379E5284
MSNLNLFGPELVVDNFAGGGGASEGIEQALGRPVDLAINHDATAIAVHTANHPGSEHAVADVWDIDPEQAVNGRPVGLAWFSPDCRHHSKAKGGRPVSKAVRGLAWVAARWAAKVKPRVIILENVEEFLDWGPLIKGADGKVRPDPARKGQTFR